MGNLGAMSEPEAARLRTYLVNGGNLFLALGAEIDDPVGPLAKVLEPFGIGIRHDDWQLRNFVNAVLQDIWTSGRYREIYLKWFQVEPDVDIETWPKG